MKGPTDVNAHPPTSGGLSGSASAGAYPESESLEPEGAGTDTDPVGEAPTPPPGESTPGDALVAQAQDLLNQIGFRIQGSELTVDGVAGPRTRQATYWFQAGWVPTALQRDGVAGPLTLEALRQSVAFGGRASPGFAYREFASKGNGEIRVERDLIMGLERLRDVSGGSILILSGYRDAAHNVSIGGAKNSQHLYGRAADVMFTAARLDMPTVRSLQVFSGIGYSPSRGNLVEHVDVRPNVSPARPTVWTYPR